MRNPKFSVIIGLYNQRSTLPALFSALKGQTLQDFEVHICDDGSDDGSGELARAEVASQNQKQIGHRWFYHRQEHKEMRLSRNINQGIGNANGEHCVFIMADSFPEIDYLETLSRWVQDDRVICGIRIQIAETDGKMQGVDLDWQIKKGLIPDFPTVLIQEPWVSLTGNGLTIPTDALREYGGWSELIEGYGGDDNELIARLYFKGYLCWSVPDLRLYHHWHKPQQSGKLNAHIAGEMIKTYAS